MIVRAHALLLWLFLASATAATLSAFASSAAHWHWSARFACQSAALATAGACGWFAARRAQEKALSMNRPAPAHGSLAEFLAVASHEMKTPLAGIKAYVELLADGDAADDVTREEFISGIGSQAERLEAAVVGLLELARGETVSPTSSAWSGEPKEGPRQTANGRRQ